MHSLARSAIVLLTFVAPLAAAQGNYQRAPVQQPTLKSQGAPMARSAESNCVREANRRGFSVIETSNFRQHSDGWSIDLRVRDSRGRTHKGSCFVETRTGDVDLVGFGWGWDDQGDDRFQFNCSSSEGRYKECQLPVNGRARLVKRRSESPCVEGRSWGQRGDRVWVNHGCRGKFEVTRFGGSGGSGGSSGAIHNADQARKACRAEAERRGLKVKDVSAAWSIGEEYRADVRAHLGKPIACHVKKSNGRVRLDY